MPKLVIALGGKSGSGKTTAAELIRHMCNERGLKCTVLSFAEPIKRIARELFGWDGDKQTYLVGAPEEMDCTKGRGLLIAVGEKLREVDPHVFSNAVVRPIMDGENGVYVIDDLRLQEEISALNTAFGPNLLLVRLTRKGPGIDDYTEFDLDGYSGWNAEVDNNGDMVSLIDKLTDILKEANRAADHR